MAENRRVAVLLRAVNVGGRNRVPMGDLVRALAARGHAEAETYLQSGNVLLLTGDPPAEAAALVRATIAGEFGVDVAAVGIDGALLHEVVAGSPFAAAAEAAPTSVHVAFFDRAIEPGRVVTRIDEASVAPDRFDLAPTHAHLWYHDGAGRSKLTVDLLERRLGVVATARNWNTVKYLAERTAPDPV